MTRSTGGIAVQTQALILYSLRPPQCEAPHSARIRISARFTSFDAVACLPLQYIPRPWSFAGRAVGRLDHGQAKEKTFGILVLARLLSRRGFTHFI